MMKLAFSKYHGTGNDFILIDNRDSNLHLSRNEIARLCDRHLGIGADGLMFLTTEEGYDFGMKYYNSDGHESTLCGNGGRCITAFASALDIIGNTALFLAIYGEHTAQILTEEGNKTMVKLKMADVRSPRPSFVIPNSSFHLDTGSPHLVVFSKHVADMDVFSAGRKLRNDPQFAPNGINVDFAEVMDDRLFVRTYERGVENETRSCGTGVTAAALAWAIHSPHPETGGGAQASVVNIDTPGGTLTVCFHQEGDTFTNIWLEGPAEFVFKGEIDFREM